MKEILKIIINKSQSKGMKRNEENIFVFFIHCEHEFYAKYVAGGFFVMRF
jgi:hypothetical protein